MASSLSMMMNLAKQLPHKLLTTKHCTALSCLQQLFQQSPGLQKSWGYLATLVSMKGSGLTQRLWYREYNIAIRTELARKEVRDNPARSAELAAYFTHAKLHPRDRALGLNSAMGIFWKAKNFATCATFARRLLELNVPQAVSHPWLVGSPGLFLDGQWEC